MIPTRQATPTELVAEFKPGATVITPNRRLARELHRRFQLMRMATGQQAWETPEVLPYDAWLRHLWGQQHHHGANQVLLNEVQLRFIWGGIIARDIAQTYAEAPLWNVSAATEQAIRAWSIIHQWDIPRHRYHTGLEDHQRFADWAARFDKKCRQSGWLDPAGLADFLGAETIPAETLPRRLTWVGFDHLTPQQQRLSAALAHRGCAVERVELAVNQAAQPEYRRYRDGYTQWLAAARWARDIVENSAEARVGIVVPNLEAERELVEYAFAQIINPQTLLTPNAERAFHLSLGQSLADIPVVAAALSILAWFIEPRVSAVALGQLLLCPYLGAAATEREARAALEQQCRRSLPWEFNSRHSVAYLRRLPGFDRVPEFGRALETAHRLYSRTPARRPCSYWADLMRQLLTAFGWPGERAPNSAEYQAIEAFHDQLRNLHSVDLVAAQKNLSDAFAELRRITRMQAFQPEAAPARVEIVGITESTGLEFDAIWMANQYSSCWPPQPIINPFIPPYLQSEAGIPTADHRLNHDLCTRIQQRLACMCQQFILSRPALDGEVKRLPGALFTDPETESPEAPRPVIEVLHDTAGQLETLMDGHGTEFKAGAISGGVGIISSQSACPFQAYARYRLGARYDDHREPGLNALDRGSMVHKILQGIWAEIGDSERLQELDQEARRELIKRVATPITRRFIKKSGLAQGYAQSLNAWLLRLVERWLEKEAEKREPGFTVIAREHEAALELAGLRLNLRIDRVDRRADGRLALVDYKTGIAVAAHRWCGSAPDYRSEYPQLGLYKMAAEQANGDPLLDGEIEGLWVAQLKLGMERWVGFDLGDLPFDIAEWEESLRARGREFCTGHAEVDPLPNACEYCGLHTLCRINDALTPDQND